MAQERLLKVPTRSKRRMRENIFKFVAFSFLVIVVCWPDAHVDDLENLCIYIILE